MATTKNLCAQIPIDLHERVSEERERLGQTTSEYIANLIQDYYNMMENQKGGIQMTEKGRTMAFQIPEELFQRIKRHLERETLRTVAFSASASSSACVIRFSTKSRWVSFLPLRSVSRSK